MARVLLILLLLPTVLMGQYSTQSFNFGGSNRQYRQYIPASYNGNTPVPVVIALHGLGDNMMNFSGIGMNWVADTANFIVLTPQALVDGLTGSTAWNSGASAFGIVLNGNVDDVGFLGAMLDSVMANYNVDASRVYACGFSMGGFMSHRLACEMNDRIAAIASVAGTIGTAVSCAPGRAVPVCHFHGTADGTIAYTGNSFGSDAEATVGYWATNNGCSNSPTVTALPDLFPDGFTVDHWTYNGCQPGADVELFKVYNADHQWLGPNNDVFYTTEIWRFFRRFQNPLLVGAATPVRSMAVGLRPNPAVEQVSVDIELETAEAVEVRLVDLRGATVLVETPLLAAGQNVVVLPVGALARGMYLLQVAGEGWQENRRLVLGDVER